LFSSGRAKDKCGSVIIYNFALLYRIPYPFMNKMSV